MVRSVVARSLGVTRALVLSVIRFRVGMVVCRWLRRWVGR